MARLAGGETHSPRFACRHESRRVLRRRRAHPHRDSHYSRCIAAGRALERRLSSARINED